MTTQNEIGIIANAIACECNGRTLELTNHQIDHAVGTPNEVSYLINCEVNFDYKSSTQHLEHFGYACELTDTVISNCKVCYIDVVQCLADTEQRLNLDITALCNELQHLIIY